MEARRRCITNWCTSSTAMLCEFLALGVTAVGAGFVGVRHVSGAAVGVPVEVAEENEK